MSSKGRSAFINRPTFALDTSSFRKLHKGNNSLAVYTVLTFIVVLLLYLGTKDWKGVTAPEEVDLGFMRVPPSHRYHRKPHNPPQRQIPHREYDD